MTYRAQELGRGQPTELYRFVSGLDVYTYTSADEAIVYQSETFLPTVIRRSNPEQTENTTSRSLTLTVARDHPFAVRFAVIVPDERTTLTIYRLHRNDAANEVTVFWQGRVRSVAWSNSAAELHCESLEALLSRQGLGPRYQVTCNHMLYDTGCRVEPGNFQAQLTVAAIAGRVITAQSGHLSAQPDGWYASGFLRRDFTDYRMIVRHVGDQATVLLPYEGLKVGDQLDAFAGCNRTRNHCKEKFANLVNFGGFPFIPRKNPFETGLD
jgi:uncharacterized phage protein (TIGR02218 family)